jgi:hypothetical protein
LLEQHDLFLDHSQSITIFTYRLYFHPELLCLFYYNLVPSNEAARQQGPVDRYLDAGSTGRQQRSASGVANRPSQSPINHHAEKRCGEQTECKPSQDLVEDVTWRLRHSQNLQ